MYSFAITFLSELTLNTFIMDKKEFTPLVMDKLKEKQT